MRLSFFLLTFFLFSASIKAETDKSQEPIKIIINDWSSQIVLSHVVGKVLESVGYKIEYPFYTVDKQFGAMNLGWAHIQVEIWEGTMLDDFEKVRRKNVVEAGTHRATTREEWWYPSYVKALCPGLPDWKALKKCSAVFATKDSGGKGVYLGGPWEKPDTKMAKALGLDFIIKTARDSDELSAYLQTAYKERRPVILFNWTPNWTELVYDGEFVEFPEYAKECETNPAWGVNAFYTHDCGNPKNGLLMKGAWKGVQTKWPCAFDILKRMDLTNRMIAEAAYLVDHDKKSYTEAAEIWLDMHPAVIKEWVPASCQN